MGPYGGSITPCGGLTPNGQDVFEFAFPKPGLVPGSSNMHFLTPPQQADSCTHENAPHLTPCRLRHPNLGGCITPCGGGTPTGQERFGLACMTPRQMPEHVDMQGLTPRQDGARNLTPCVLLPCSGSQALTPSGHGHLGFAPLTPWQKSGHLDIPSAVPRHSPRPHALTSTGQDQVGRALSDSPPPLASGMRILYTSRTNGLQYPGLVEGRTSDGKAWQLCLDCGDRKEVADGDGWRIQVIA